jgi:hypothetical protein
MELKLDFLEANLEGLIMVQRIKVVMVEFCLFGSISHFSFIIFIHIDVICFHHAREGVCSFFFQKKKGL